MPVDCLGRIIREKCREALCDGAVTLKDEDQEVTVPDLGDKAVVIRLDQCIGELSGVADGRWKKLCDYLIVRQGESGTRALFVELKKSFSDKNFRQGSEQLRKSLPLFEYLRWMCRVEGGAELEEYEARYVLIVERPYLSKSRTRHRDNQPISGDPASDQPIRKTRHKEIDVSCYRYLDGQSIPFDRLWR